MFKLTQNRRVGFFIISILIIVMMSLCAQAAKKSTATKKTKLKSKLGGIQHQIREVKYKIEQKKDEQRTVTGQLTAVECKLDNAQSSVNDNSLKLQDVKTKLALTIDRLNHTKRRLARRQNLFTRRIVDIYEGEDLNYANVVLGSTDMWTFLTRAYYLKQILNSDTMLIRQIREDKDEIEKDKCEQLRQVSKISSLQTQLESERNQVASLADQKRNQLDKIENSKDLMEQALDELEQQSQEIEDQIRRIQQTPMGRKRYARAFTGGLSLPCSGRISSGFGYRVHPITHVYKLHTGVDICVPMGTPLHAAANGTVIMAGWYGAYGYAVIIDHGGGVQTLYGHCSHLLVRPGQDVKRGEVIAKSGSTGYSTGPHCHFEKRINGKPVNPGG